MADDQDEPVTFGEVFGAMTPPGTDKAALLDALRRSVRTGGQLPGRLDLGAPPRKDRR